MQQLQFPGQQQQMNTRYGNMQSSGPNSAQGEGSQLSHNQNPNLSQEQQPLQPEP